VKDLGLIKSPEKNIVNFLKTSPANISYAFEEGFTSLNLKIHYLHFDKKICHMADKSFDLTFMQDCYILDSQALTKEKFKEHIINMQIKLQKNYEDTCRYFFDEVALQELKAGQSKDLYSLLFANHTSIYYELVSRPYIWKIYFVDSFRRIKNVQLDTIHLINNRVKVNERRMSWEDFVFLLRRRNL